MDKEKIKDKEITLQEMIEFIKKENITIEDFQKKYIHEIQPYIDITQKTFKNLEKVSLQMQEKTKKINFRGMARDFLKKISDEAFFLVEKVQPKIIDFLGKMLQEIKLQKDSILSEIKELLEKPSTTAKQKESLEAMQKTLISDDCYLSYLQEAREELKKIRKAQESKSKTVRFSMYAEHQKLGKSQDAINELFSLFSDKGVNVEKSVIADKMGFNLTLSEQNALFAIQKCMSDRKYKPILFVRDTPYYSVEIAEYLENYGVKKRTTKRGWSEFLSNERKEAIAALNSLGEKKAVIRYEKKYLNEKGKTNYDIIELNEEIVKLVKSYERLTEKEKESLLVSDEGREKKLTRIVFIPCQPIFDGIDNYFCLKDADYRQKIKQIAKKSNSAAINLFIDYIYIQASEKFRQKQGLVIRISPKELAYKLRMKKDIEKRNWKRIKKEIERAIGIAKELGYITESELEKGTMQDEVYFFKLNHERFYIE